MTRVKGSNLRLARQYADEHSSGSWSRILEHLSAEDRAVISSGISAGWYELALQHRLFAALEEVLEPDVIERFARYAAEHDLTRVHRLFLKLKNPAYVLEKSGDYWSRFYDAGRWTVVRVSDRQARGELIGIDEPSPQFCRFLKAYIERMFELAGAQGLTCRHTRCVLRGDPSCVFEGGWR